MTLTYEGEEISNVIPAYFDTVAVAQALVILKTGLLRVAAVRGSAYRFTCRFVDVTTSWTMRACW